MLRGSAKKKFAILISKELLEDPEGFRERAPFYVEFAEYANEHGYKPFFLAPVDIDYDTRKVTGYDVEFETFKSKMPALVYKAHASLYGGKGPRRRAIQDYNDGNVLYLNSNEFCKLAQDKYRSYRRLKEVEEIVPYLPKTWILSYVDREKLLKEYSDYISKPRHGSQGRDVRKVSELSKEQLDEIYKSPRRTVVQQFVTGARIDGKVFDFRIGLINHFGKFSIAYEFARQSPDKGYLTNLSQGGSALSVESVIEAVGEKPVDAARKIAPKIAAQLEAESEYASICSVDFLIDDKGKPWFVEANADPVWSMLYAGLGIDKESVMEMLLERVGEILQDPDRYRP